MVLVDTSVWIDHFAKGDPGLQSLLNSYDVACHPLVIGELACGNLKRRDEILAYMQSLPSATEASYREVLYFIHERGIAGKGVGYIDAALLAAAAVSGILLWTRDRRLHTLAVKFKMAYVPDGAI